MDFLFDEGLVKAVKPFGLALLGIASVISNCVLKLSSCLWVQEIRGR